MKYIFPDINLLNSSYDSTVSTDIKNTCKKTAERLMNILTEFCISATLIQISVSSHFTTYEIIPKNGVHLSNITKIKDIIASSLAVPNVNIADIPQKRAIRISIPNDVRYNVTLRPIVESEEFRQSSKLAVAIGMNSQDNIVTGDLLKLHHLLIGGTTGSGKSMLIHSILISMLYKTVPNDVRLIIIDPSGVEYEDYNNIPHLLVPIVTETKKAAGALNWAIAEMMRRYDLFKETRVRNLDTYNKMMENADNCNRLPHIIIIIDEIAELMKTDKKEFEDYICRISQLGRASGVHIILTTQTPKIITKSLKASIPSKISFTTSSIADSRMILDSPGAESLSGNGDMLYQPFGHSTPIRVQGAFVPNDIIKRVTMYIKNMYFNTEFEDGLERYNFCSKINDVPDSDSDSDSLLPKAVTLAVDVGKITTSMLQRRLSVSYSRACRLINQMEAQEIISKANGSKPRDVIISRELYENKFK